MVRSNGAIRSHSAYRYLLLESGLRHIFGQLYKTTYEQSRTRYLDAKR